MSDEQTVDETTQNEAETVTEEATTEVEDTTENQEEEVDVEELKKQAKLAENYKIRAEKAEKALKKNKPTESQAPSQSEISNKDILYLAKADINPEDVDDVLDYAKLKGITIAEAHKFYKPILNEREEERKTAQATTVKSGRGSTKNSGEDFLRRAETTGEVPDDPAKMREMIEADFNRRRKGN
jgi:hypothetical protein